MSHWFVRSNTKNKKNKTMTVFCEFNFLDLMRHHSPPRTIQDSIHHHVHFQWQHLPLMTWWLLNGLSVQAWAHVLIFCVSCESHCDVNWLNNSLSQPKSWLVFSTSNLPFQRLGTSKKITYFLLLKIYLFFTAVVTPHPPGGGCLVDSFCTGNYS